MKKIIAAVLIFFTAFLAFSAGEQEEKKAPEEKLPEEKTLLEKAQAEGKATFYANITALQFL